jgi:hypothetical protein
MPHRVGGGLALIEHGRANTVHSTAIVGRRSSLIAEHGWPSAHFQVYPFAAPVARAYFGRC